MSVQIDGLQIHQLPPVSTGLTGAALFPLSLQGETKHIPLFELVNWIGSHKRRLFVSNYTGSQIIIPNEPQYNNGNLSDDEANIKVFMNGVLAYDDPDNIIDDYDIDRNAQNNSDAINFKNTIYAMNILIEWTI